MRKKIIAGNWKMNGRYDMAIDLVSAVKAGVDFSDECDVIFFPPFLYLKSISYEIPFLSRFSLGAQNLSAEDDGAFTGEISGGMLKDVDCKYVLIGHSERRQLYGEDNTLVNRKVKKALECKLLPLICCGETLEEYEGGKTLNVIEEQIGSAFNGLSAEDALLCTIAYEPVWAIGTGKTSTPENAGSVHASIRSLLRDIYSDYPHIAEEMPILYGGSVKPDNAGMLLSQPDIDGALVGGASLKAEDFVAIIKAAVKK